MAQHDYSIANQGFPAFRSDLNDALAAIVSNNSGATEPTTMFAHQIWVDTAANPSILKIRNADNDAWITIGSINQTADTFTLTSAVSASTLNTSGQVVFNDAGADVDFRVEGDTDANLLFVDASADAVGIKTTAPQANRALTLGAFGPVSTATAAQTQRLTIGGKFNDTASTNQWSFISWSFTAGTNDDPFAVSPGSENGKNWYIGPQSSTAFFAVPKFAFVANGSEKANIDFSGNFSIQGSTATKASGTTWANPSDQRLKDNIRDYEKGLAELQQVRVREWEYNGKGGTTEGRGGLGVVADEIMSVLPNTVDTYEAKLNSEDKEDSEIKRFDATEITWLLVNAVKELKAITDTQAQTISALETRIASLEGQ